MSSTTRRAISPSRLTHTQHDHHDLTVASMHVHLDNKACLEVSILRGPSSAINGLADALATQRGVRHAQLHLVPVTVSTNRHHHGERGGAHQHLHA